jgi:hypothetical protein
LPTPAPSNPTTPLPAASPRPDKGNAVDSAVAAAKVEPRATPLAAPVPTAAVTSAQSQAVPKTQPPAPASDGAQQPGDARPPAQKANASSSVNSSTKVEDPFADLESLEAEMARLLGREKPS